MGILDGLKTKPAGTKPADEQKKFPASAPALEPPATRKVDATAIGQRLVRDAEKKGDAEGLGEAIAAVPADADILKAMNPPAGQSAVQAQSSTPSIHVAEESLPSVDVVLLEPSVAEPLALPRPGSYSVEGLMGMDPSDLLKLALAECNQRGIADVDALIDERSMRPFVKAFNKRSIPLDDIFVNMQAMASSPVSDSRPRTRLDSPQAKNDDPIPVSIRMDDDALPHAETAIAPSGQLQNSGAAAPAQRAKPPPIPKTKPPAPKPAGIQSPDSLGIHAFIKRTDDDPNLNAAQKVDAAKRHFEENVGIQEFIGRYGQLFLKLLEGAAAKVNAGQSPEGDEIIALDINALYTYMRDKEARADKYAEVRKDIKDNETKGTPVAPLPFTQTDPKLRSAPAGPVPLEKRRNAFLRFISSPTTLSTIGAAAFGGVMYHFGAFDEAVQGVDKAFAYLNKEGPHMARETMMAVYSTVTSLSILVTELIRRFKVDRKYDRFEKVESLPADVRAIYGEVLSKLSNIARTHAKREDQTEALSKELKDEKFFSDMDDLGRLHHGKPLVAAIDASGMNRRVYVDQAMEVAEIKIMANKFSKVATYLRSKDTRHAVFKSMYASDALFRKECDKLLVTDRNGNFLHLRTLHSICQKIKGDHGEDITKELMQALHDDHSYVDSRFSK
jgi:hypothetical protein